VEKRLTNFAEGLCPQLTWKHYFGPNVIFIKIYIKSKQNLDGQPKNWENCKTDHLLL